MPEGVRVKICGLMRREDALEADRLGADYLGVIMSEGFGRSVEPSLAGDLLEGSNALKVAVLVNEAPDRAEKLAGRLDADVVQLHGDEAPEVVVELRERGGWALWKAVRAHSLQDLERALELYAALVDGILLEGWREGRVGGAGAALRLDPDLVRRLVPTELDFVLAGGLTSSTVAEAVARFGPDVVDVSSGIERVRGQKDPELVRTFIESARLAGGFAAE